jgi:hypothetical protein
MYRDDAAAARARLACLVRALAERRAAQVTLRRYRRALYDEASRLRRALRWYRDGERYGFRRVRRCQNLAAAEPELPRLPGAEQLDRALARLDPRSLAARSDALARELAEDDPPSLWLKAEVASLRAECAGLRAELEVYAARHPHRRPPAEVSPVPALALGSALLALLSALGAFIGMGFC